MRKLLLASAAILLTVGSAHAGYYPSTYGDIFTSSITAPNDTLSGAGYGSSNFGTITVTRTSATTATVNFTANSGFAFGGAQATDLNVNAASFTDTNFSWTPLVNAVSLQGTPGTTQNVNNHGTFNNTIDLFDGFTHSATSETFTLTNLSGTWGSAGQVLLANESDFDAAAHIFAYNPSNVAGGAIVTGFAGEYAAVPGPILGAGLPGLLAACFGLMALARGRRDRQKVLAA